MKITELPVKTDWLDKDKVMLEFWLVALLTVMYKVAHWPPFWQTETFVLPAVVAVTTTALPFITAEAILVLLLLAT